MVTATTILFGILSVQYVLGVPSDNDEFRKFLKLANDEPTSDDDYLIFENEENVENKKTQGQRQKRWYDNMPYNYPPPFARPYDRESDLESSLSSIRSNLDLILNLAKSPPQPPPPSIYPVYIPIYIPQPVCGCNPVYPEQPTTKAPELPTTTNQDKINGTIPDLTERFPEMEDERQNWGLLVNNTVADYDDDNDGSRPISLGPVPQGDDGAPSVDHGSSQADVNNSGTSAVNPPIAVASLDNASQRNCDNAVLSCCLGPNKTYGCIQSRGCNDETLSQTPCDPRMLLRTITRIQNYLS